MLRPSCFEAKIYSSLQLRQNLQPEFTEYYECGAKRNYHVARDLRPKSYGIFRWSSTIGLNLIWLERLHKLVKNCSHGFLYCIWIYFSSFACYLSTVDMLFLIDLFLLMVKHKFNYSFSHNKACYILFLSINANSIGTEKL
jgi:hypothetical protein